ncbi:MAG: cysteine peptidase family C39 domain-containing protein [Caldilineaceae bacterium]
MNHQRSIFRQAALQRYRGRRDHAVLPTRVIRQRRRVPVLFQMSATECGAACLAMILGFYGRSTRVAECREPLHGGRDGVTAQQIVTAARRFGLRVKAYSIQQIADLQQVQLPAIAHWDFNHFVVIERWSAKTITVIDPASGRQQLPIAEFEAGFTGVVLTCEPGAHFAPRATAAALPWRTFVRPLWRTPNLLWQIVLASLVLQGLGLALPLFTQLLVDRLLPSHQADHMPLIALGMVLLIGTTGFLITPGLLC